MCLFWKGLAPAVLCKRYTRSVGLSQRSHFLYEQKVCKESFKGRKPRFPSPESPIFPAVASEDATFLCRFCHYSRRTLVNWVPSHDRGKVAFHGSFLLLFHIKNHRHDYSWRFINVLGGVGTLFQKGSDRGMGQRPIVTYTNSIVTIFLAGMDIVSTPSLMVSASSRSSFRLVR